MSALLTCEPPTLLTDRVLARAPASLGDYTVRLAGNEAEVRAAQALRFAVFNLELGEGFAESFMTGLDADPFDAACDHLLVEHRATGEIIGTYRLQTGAQAAARLGYYSAQEFAFGPYEPLRAEVVELGRACVHRAHRSRGVLGLLWKGITDYAARRGGRYLIGCSSLTTQDPAVGAAAYAALAPRHLAAPALLTEPQPAFACALHPVAPTPPAIPKLLMAYLALGAKICAPPALDRTFGTIDFLTLLDLATLSPGRWSATCAAEQRSRRN